jgi:periplasmic protein TonB
MPKGRAWAFYTIGLSDPAAFVVHKLNRNLAIAGSVVLFHFAALWALQTGLLRRAVEIVVPVSILSEIVTPPAPKIEPPPAPPPPKPPEAVKPAAPRKVERASPAPQPVAVPDQRPAPEAPTGIPVPQPAPPPMAAPLTPEPTGPAPAPAPARIELPTSDASYLQNPPPTYPPISKRLGEQGKVLVRVLIGADGSPRDAEVKRSSGYARLDNAAIEYVLRCRYVPGKVGGIAQAMWYEAPVNFILE